MSVHRQHCEFGKRLGGQLAARGRLREAVDRPAERRAHRAGGARAARHVSADEESAARYVPAQRSSGKQLESPASQFVLVSLCPVT